MLVMVVVMVMVMAIGVVVMMVAMVMRMMVMVMKDESCPDLFAPRIIRIHLNQMDANDTRANATHSLGLLSGSPVQIGNRQSLAIANLGGRMSSRVGHE